MKTKQKIAREILSVQKILFISIGCGIVTLLICLILFRPFKFDNEKYKHVPVTYGIYSVSVPYEYTEGFGDYLDGQVLWDPTNYEQSYKKRKEYLLNKTIRYSLYAIPIVFVSLLSIRYLSKGQKWVIKNANNS